MDHVSQVSAPGQAIRATERFGFFETAEAMKRIAGAFMQDVPQRSKHTKTHGLSAPTTGARLRFSRFRNKFHPFE
jgi:hypothetical protein